MPNGHDHPQPEGGPPRSSKAQWFSAIAAAASAFAAWQSWQTAKQSAEIAERSTKIAAQAHSTAEASLEVSRAANSVAKRPYVGKDSLAIQDHVNGKNLVMVFSIKNFGSAVATNVVIEFAAAVGGQKLTADGEPSTGAVLMPGGSFGFGPFIAGSQSYEAVMNGVARVELEIKASYFAAGRIYHYDYKGVFNPQFRQMITITENAD